MADRRRPAPGTLPLAGEASAPPGQPPLGRALAAAGAAVAPPEEPGAQQRSPHQVERMSARQMGLGAMHHEIVGDEHDRDDGSPLPVAILVLFCHDGFPSYILRSTVELRQ